MNQIAAIDPSAVRDRAYARWQARGCPEGSPEQDWLDAEHELTRERVSKLELVPEASASTVNPSSVSSGASSSGASSPVAGSPVASKEVSKRQKPPRPTLKREPVTTRGAKLVPQKPLASSKRAAG